jgi:DMSO/TMAO reductase YedYZ heme-binding membrane subunit
MLNTQQKPTGTGYTTTVAFLVVGLIFSPAVLIVQRPLTAMPIALSLICSIVCVGLAWANWRRSSRLTITTIAPDSVAK